MNTVIYDRHGDVIAELHGAENRVLVKSDQIPEVMKQATVAVEDQRFYEHHGVDIIGIARAAVADLKAGAVVQGGSTITAQYVKNAYVGGEQSMTRKLREAVLAYQLENRWDKDHILTAYLNTVYFGSGAYGVEAASRTYFHKSAQDMTLKEAALLAALIRLPSQYAPTTDPKQAKIAAQPGAQPHGAGGLHHAGAGGDGAEDEPGRLQAPARREQRQGGLLRRLRDPAAHQAVRLEAGVRGRPAGLHEHRHDVARSRFELHRQHHRRRELGLQSRRRSRGDRPEDGLYPHHGGRHRLQQAQVQPRLAVAPPARVPP